MGECRDKKACLFISDTDSDEAAHIIPACATRDNPNVRMCQNTLWSFVATLWGRRGRARFRSIHTARDGQNIVTLTVTLHGKWNNAKIAPDLEAAKTESITRAWL